MRTLVRINPHHHCYTKLHSLSGHHRPRRRTRPPAASAACAALFVLHRVFPAPPAVWSAGGEQFTQLRSLQGTWQDSAGGKIVFTATSSAPGGIPPGGKVTFINVPQVFSWAAGSPPPSYGHGTWTIGTSSRHMMGLQNQPDAGIISIQFGTETLGTYPLVGLDGVPLKAWTL